MKKVLLLIGLLSFIYSKSNATQSPTVADKVKVLNTYVDFLNESTHGMLVVHRLLENYNQDINKYVDLEGSQINFYSNADIPFNIFEDPENLFYEISPHDLGKTFVKQSDVLGSDAKDLLIILKKIQSLTSQVNDLRFSVESTIKDNDLHDTDHLAAVYTQLEKGVSLYNDMYLNTNKAKDILNNIFKKLLIRYDVKDKALYDHFNMIHTGVWDILVSLRDKNDLDFEERLILQKTSGERFNKMITSLGLSNAKDKRSLKKINRAYQKAHESAKRFYEVADVDQEYKLYGKYYFYHNSDVINKFNRYGSGYVFEINRWLERMPADYLKFLEMPHYYQVIYPKKLEKADAISSTDNKIEVIPKKLKDREIISNTRSIEVDTNVVELKIYDHMIQDGDIVSINFNGDWILESYSLEAKPVDLKLKLNADGKNYLLLHAESVGKRPPNTVGISYYYKGVEEKIMMKSDMKASEMIEINLQK